MGYQNVHTITSLSCHILVCATATVCIHAGINYSALIFLLSMPSNNRLSRCTSLRLMIVFDSCNKAVPRLVPLGLQGPMGDAGHHLLKCTDIVSPNGTYKTYLNIIKNTMII